MGFTDRLKHSWNAFLNPSTATPDPLADYGPSYGHRPDRPRPFGGYDRSIITSIYVRMAVDAAGVEWKHVRLDERGRYKEDVNSDLNHCFRVSPNIDQAPRHFRQDIFYTLFTQGELAIVPIETTLNPNQTSGYDISNLRVGSVVAWYPEHVKVEIYNEKTGKREQLTMPKKFAAIVENPFYDVMNGQNSTLARLSKKLSILDAIDEQAGSGKLDMIIQLPYTIRSESRRVQAQQRREDMEDQLANSKYGVAYADAAEKITQLNRPVENNLLKQIEYLNELLYNQLGLTKSIMDGTADQAAMLNYQNRTTKPLLDAVAEAMRRTFLTKNAITRGQWIMYFRDPFAYVPIEVIAEIADKFTRNEIATGNEIRQGIGWAPHPDPKADELGNSNIPVGDRGGEPVVEGEGEDDLAQLDKTIAEIEDMLSGNSS